MARPPKPARKPVHWGCFGAAAWASIAAVLTAAILIFDFITKGIGIIDPIQKLCCAEKPKVTVTVRPNDWSGECLKFAFENLPSGLAIARIRLNVTKAAGPNAIARNPTADIKTVAVSAELPRSIFTDEHPRPIEFDVNQQASKDQDTLFVNYCPTLNVSSQSGKLTVQPDFLSPDGSPIKGLSVALPDNKPITFTISRPTYLDPKVDPKAVK
jgi:hypothetical protein